MTHDMERTQEVGANVNPEKVEGEHNADQWILDRENAPKLASEMIEAIHGFESMSIDMKIETLDNLMQQLSHDSEGNIINNNKYVVREIGRTWETLQGQRDLIERLKRVGSVV